MMDKKDANVAKKPIVVEEMMALNKRDEMLKRAEKEMRVKNE